MRDLDLSTTYLGIELAHPVVPCSSPLSYDVDGICLLEDAGAPAIVLHSLFEEEITHESQLLDYYLSHGTESFAESLTYLPEREDYQTGPDSYLELIRKAKEAVDIPLIGSLNGTSAGGWIEYAQRIQEAGADALELNVYHIATDPNISGAEVETRYLEILTRVKESVDIPVAVKLSPAFSSIPHMAARLAEAGADALVLFNRFYQPDFDLDQLEVVPTHTLSTSEDLRLPLRWVAILHGRIPAQLALTGGVHNNTDVLKAVMAGARVAMAASELLANGPSRIEEIVAGMRTWMEEHEYASIAQMRGSMSQAKVEDPQSFERTQYMRVLHSFKLDPPPTGL